ncbi:MAG: SRPBCC family protein [Corynebacteriales bacterium]|nr:SRPBCC family protein [Mycobacteriales bacterium]
MGITLRAIPASAADVFAVLADGWAYASWVVGTTHVRSVDSNWPAVGSRIHHKVGPWPLSINDYTQVQDVEPEKFLALRARGWPLGEARVNIRLNVVDDQVTEVSVEEVISAGVGRHIPDPLIAPLFQVRNSEALRRLGDIAVHREKDS